MNEILASVVIIKQDFVMSKDCYLEDSEVYDQPIIALCEKFGHSSICWVHVPFILEFIIMIKKVVFFVCIENYTSYYFFFTYL